jgi:hypothetical protein
VIEVRKAEGGSRAWQASPGEYYHATSGERGGIWRNRAWPPQKIFGVGFTSEGFDRSSHYFRMPDGLDPQAAWILEGVKRPTASAISAWSAAVLRLRDRPLRAFARHASRRVRRRASRATATTTRTWSRRSCSITPVSAARRTRKCAPISCTSRLHDKGGVQHRIDRLVR